MLHHFIKIDNTQVHNLFGHNTTCNVSTSTDDTPVNKEFLKKNITLFESLSKLIKSTKFAVCAILMDQYQNLKSKTIISVTDNLGINIKELQNDYIYYTYLTKKLDELISNNNFFQKYDELTFKKHYFYTEEFYFYQLLLQKVLFDIEVNSKSKKKVKSMFCLKDLDDTNYKINDFFFLNYIIIGQYNYEKIYNSKFLLKALNIDRMVTYVLFLDFKIIFNLSNLDCKRKIEFCKKFINILIIDPDFLINATTKFQNTFKIDEHNYLFIKNFVISSFKNGISRDKIQRIDRVFSNIINYFK